MVEREYDRGSLSVDVAMGFVRGCCVAFQIVSEAPFLAFTLSHDVSWVLDFST
jgi:hypothetical protein